MRPEITPAVAEALRFPHEVVVKVEVWRGGTRLDMDLPGGLPVLGGQVKDDATAKVRRSLALELPASDAVWELLAVPGTELRPFRGVRFSGGGGVTTAPVAPAGRLGVDPLGSAPLGGESDGTVTVPLPGGGGEVWVPLGRMEVDQPRMGYAPSGNLSVSGVDGYAKVQASEFLLPGVAELGTLITTQLVTFLQQALPTVPIQLNLTNNWIIGSKVYETDRAAAIEEMLTAIGAELLFDGVGTAVIRPAPTVSPQAAWVVDEGATGVMVSADRQGMFGTTRNVVVVTSVAVDGEPAFDPVYVWDDNPTSPTYAGPDPINNPGAAGPFGVRATRLSSAAIGNVDQALQAGAARLAQVTGRSSQLTLTSAVHPGLEAGDTIGVRLPPDPVSGLRPIEAHLVESVTIPLSVDGAQNITTRARGIAA